MESGGRWVWRARAQGARQQRQGPIQAQPSNKGSYFLKLLYTTRVDEVVIYLYISFEYMCRCSKIEAMSSKLKLSKSYLRSTMTQEGLNNLATIALESALLEKIEYE